MRLFRYGVGVSTLGLLIGALPACGSDGSSGPATEFEAEALIVVSGPSPFSECIGLPDQGERLESSVEPWISVNPQNPEHLVGAWIQGPAAGLVSAMSFDGGATWEERILPGISRCSGGDWERSSDPWLAFASNEDLYSVALSHGESSSGFPAIQVHKSVDGGRTWGEPTIISEAAGEDKPSIAADPVDPCLIFVGWSRLTGESGPDELLLSRTTDCGESWTEPEVLSSSELVPFATQILVLPDGTVLVFFKVQLEGAFYVMRSTDQGATWDEEPTLIVETGLQSKPVTPDREDFIRAGFDSFDVAVDRETGYLTAVWQDFFQGAPVSSPGQVAFSSSQDGGLTWTEPVRIDRTPTNTEFTLEQAFMPSVEVSDDGTIGVSYYNFENARADGPPYWADRFFTHCHPELADCSDPESWGDAIRLTPESFDYAMAPYVDQGDRHGYFLGDYVGLASAGSDFLAFFSVSTDEHPADVVFVRVRGR